MSTRTKTLAKSLHTVTALVQVARYIRITAKQGTRAADLVSAACAVLGYKGAADPYDLRGKAAEILLQDLAK